jgi:hypothetical protein
MELGAGLELSGNVLRVIPRSDIYIGYLSDHQETIAALASEFYGRPIGVQLAPASADTQTETEAAPPPSGGKAATSNGRPATPLDDRKRKVNYALAYGRHGMAVFPCHHIEADRQCSCGKLQCASAGKHPRNKGWQVEATTDEATIRNWWTVEPEANIGVACGKCANLTVLDVDPQHGGSETLRELELEHGELPETPVAHTGSGGRHYYFAYEPGLSNAVGFAPGLDIRTEGGLVVGVGSFNLHGGYAWEVGFELSDKLQPAKMPLWLVEKIKRGQGGNKAPGEPFKVPPKIPEGQRNSELYKAGRSAKARNVPAAGIRAELESINRERCEPPVMAAELERVFQSIMNGADRPNFNDYGAPVLYQNGNGGPPAASNGYEIKPLPAPMKAGEWFAEEKARFANTSFIWDGILEAGGYTMIGGKKGHGKSTFARTLAFKISRGEEFMGRQTVRSKVWDLDFEPGGKGRIDTLEKLGWCDDDWLEFSTIPPPANHPDVFKWLRRYIIERGFKVIIVDTLFKLLRIDGANDYDKGLYAQVPLEEICRELGVCIIVLHHARKNGQFSSHQSCAEQMLGATSISGAACACILINHRSDTYTFRMDPPRYGEPIEGEVVLERDAQGFVNPAGSWKRKWASTTKQRVIEAATAKNGWFTVTDLLVSDPERQDAPLKRSSLYWAIGELVKENLLEEGRPEYPPESGGPLPPSRKGGKPVTQYRVMATFSGAQTAPAERNLWR